MQEFRVGQLGVHVAHTAVRLGASSLSYVMGVLTGPYTRLEAGKGDHQSGSEPCCNRGPAGSRRATARPARGQAPGTRRRVCGGTRSRSCSPFFQGARLPELWEEAAKRLRALPRRSGVPGARLLQPEARTGVGQAADRSRRAGSWPRHSAETELQPAVRVPPANSSGSWAGSAERRPAAASVTRRRRSTGEHTAVLQLGRS